MKVNLLGVVIYESHWSWHSEERQNPSWPQIEQALRQMNKFHRPIVTLLLTDKDSDGLWFTGGSNTWHIQKRNIATDEWQQAVNPNGSDEEVEVWTSDQGFSTSGWYVFKDSDTVLKIAKYFCDTGDFATFVAWE
jgi:hypothetical protein